MVQTYEGALTETDSILQRMKTLADQAANGTYQDDVDRDAIQLEFNQLNDELDQIADTDFNGVVVLNGGQMSDGTKAVDGKFDYANKVRAAKQLSSADINKVDYQKFDDTDNTKGVTKADKIWNTISGANDWDRKDTTKDDGPDSVDVTLKYDKGNNTWVVDSANNGADKTTMSVTMTDNGGFVLKAGNDEIANIVMDGTSLINGDTITLTLKNPKAQIAAPTNAGAVVTNTDGYTEGPLAADLKAQNLNLTVTIDAGIKGKNDKMNEQINKLFTQLDGATVKVNYAASTDTVAGDMTITLSDGTEIKGATDGAFTLKDGTQFYATKTTAGEITISTVNSTGAADAALVKLAAPVSADTDAGNGEVTYKVGVDFNSYDVAELPSVEVKSPDDGAVSKSNAYGQATAPLTYTDHIVLQSGARTKDAVDFTFKYSCGGMGDLKANMNCSSRADGLGTANLKLTDQKSANYAIDRIDNAINKVSMVRATFGAVQNRLEHKIDNMNVTKENMTSAESRIRDTNMAEEMTNFTKNQILSQASQAMLAQANQLPQGVLQLLG